MACLQKAAGLQDVDRQGREGLWVFQDGGEGGFNLQVVEFVEEVETLGFEFPTKEDKMLSGLWLVTDRAVWVIGSIDPM